MHGPMNVKSSCEVTSQLARYQNFWSVWKLLQVYEYLHSLHAIFHVKFYLLIIYNNIWLRPKLVT
jgi:hypothetical protein